MSLCKKEEEIVVQNFSCLTMIGNFSIYRQQKVVWINVYCALSKSEQPSIKVVILHKSHNFS